MDLEHKAIERIKMASEMSLHHYGKPLICTYSGGKDSDVMLELFKRSGVPFEAHHNHTTADAPHTVYHIRKVFRELELSGVKCDIDYHIRPDGSRITMWNLIQTNGVPTRICRFCCRYLKESGCRGRMIATGVRWGESKKRAERGIYESKDVKEKRVSITEEKMLLTDNDDSRKLFEKCEMKAETIVNPIIEWPDYDICDFYWNECKHHNPLYKMGYTRVGCVGCPMAGKTRWKEFSDFPAYKIAYIKAFEKMLEMRKCKGKEQTKWKNGHDVFLWWMEDDNIPGQMSFDDFIE